MQLDGIIPVMHVDRLFSKTKPWPSTFQSQRVGENPVKEFEDDWLRKMTKKVWSSVLSLGHDKKLFH